MTQGALSRVTVEAEVLLQRGSLGEATMAILDLCVVGTNIMVVAGTLGIDSGIRFLDLSYRNELNSMWGTEHVYMFGILLCECLPCCCSGNDRAGVPNSLPLYFSLHFPSRKKTLLSE